jgi:hypothetical protein
LEQASSSESEALVSTELLCEEVGVRRTQSETTFTGNASSITRSAQVYAN